MAESDTQPPRNQGGDKSSSRPNLHSLEGGGQTSPRTSNPRSVPTGSNSGPIGSQGLRALEGGRQTSPRAGNLHAVNNKEAGNDPLGAINNGIAGVGANAGSLFNPEVAAAASKAQKVAGFFWGSKARKRGTILGGGGLITTAVIAAIFIAFLPNEVVSLMSQLENHFFAGIELDIEKESDRLISDYIKHRILQRLGLQCSSSVNLKKCIAEGKAKINKVDCEDGDEVCKLFNSWDDSDLAGQFAENGITFTEEDGRVYMHGDQLPDGKLDVTDFSKDDTANLFDNSTVESSGFVDTLHNVKDKLVVSVGSYLHESFTKLFHGVSFDGDGLGTREEDASDVDEATKEGALQANEAGEMEADYGVELQEAMSCMTDPGCDPTARQAGTTDAAQDPSAGVPESENERATDDALDQVTQNLPTKKLADLLKSYNDLKTKGTDALADIVARLISNLPGIDVSQAAVKELAGKFSIVGWVQMAAQIINFLSGANTKLKALNYSIHAAPFIAEFAMYASEADKQKSGCTGSTGHCQNDLTMIGSFAKGLSAGGSTATSNSFVQYSTNSNDTTQSASSVHSDLLNNHMALNDYHNALTDVSGGLNSIPGFNWLADLAGLLSKIIGGVLAPINWGVSGLLGVTGINDLIGKAVGPLLTALTTHVFPMPPLNNLSGQQRGGILAVGNHLAASKAGDALGGKRVSAAVSAVMTNDQENADYQQFREQPLFARMFSADTPYSFASQLSLKIPTNFSTMLQTSFASLLENPLGKLFGSFSTVLHPSHVFAAAAAVASPDGVSDNLIPTTDAVFSTDSETYWKEHNCAQQQKQDYPNWNSHTALDQDTGQTYHTTTNGCLLMERSSETMGTLSGLGD